MSKTSIRKYFIEELLAWGKSSKRDVPWRIESDPFRILVAAIMLQRSRAKTVSPVYKTLFEKFPRIDDIANAPVSEILTVIQPLGLVSRAETLKSIAQTVRKLGGVPKTLKDLLALPGVGRYTASATIAMAFAKSEPMVDSVTARVYRRFFGLSDSEQELWAFVENIFPNQHAIELNWAVLDLAASICLPKKPRCEICPISKGCDYAKNK